MMLPPQQLARRVGQGEVQHSDLQTAGTVGIELQEQVAEQLAAESSPRKGLDAIITPCGGGGLTSGVALSVCVFLAFPPCLLSSLF